MTIYEQIQRSLNYIEDNLLTQLKQEQAAREAGMSLRGFRNYFWSVTGYSFKNYVIKRRLSTALIELEKTDKSILEIALEIGYGSHEAFSRVFKEEFDVSPQNFRQCRPCLNRLEKITLFKEMYMGVIVKELPEMPVVTFEGHGREPENRAKEKLEKWQKKNPRENRQRVFGHNINAEGESDNNPDNEGYKFLLTIDHPEDADGENFEKMEAGKFVVTGIEGNFENDPTGTWIKEGWGRMTEMIKRKRYKIKEPGRWFEEELEPSTPGNLRLDLYIEIE